MIKKLRFHFTSQPQPKPKPKPKQRCLHHRLQQNQTFFLKI